MPSTETANKYARPPQISHTPWTLSFQILVWLIQASLLYWDCKYARPPKISHPPWKYIWLLRGNKNLIFLTTWMHPRVPSGRTACAVHDTLLENTCNCYVVTPSSLWIHSTMWMHPRVLSGQTACAVHGMLLENTCNWYVVSTSSLRIRGYIGGCHLGGLLV